MNEFLISFVRKHITVLVYTFFIFNGYGQHEKLIDSLAGKSSFEKRRIFYGYMESKGSVLFPTQKRAEYLAVIEKFAKENNEKDLLREIEFVRYKKKEVYDFPRKQWSEKFNIIIEKYKKEKNLLFLIYCYHENGGISFDLENYQEAFETYIKCMDAINKIGPENVPNLGKILHEISLQYYFFKDYEQVIKLMRMSIKYPPFSKGLDIQRYNNLGVSYQKLQKVDSANYFFNQGLKVAKSYNYPTWEGLFYANLGELYYDQKKFDSSFYFYEKSYRINSNEKLSATIKLNSLINLAKINLQLGDLSKTKSFLDKATVLIYNTKEIDFGDKQLIENSKLNYYEIKIKYLMRINAFKLALLYKDSAAIGKSKLDQTYNSAILKLSEKQIKISNTEAALIQKEKDKNKQSFLYITIVIVLLSVVLTGIYYIYWFKVRKRKQGELLVAQNKRITLEKSQAKKELELARNEMQFFVTKISEQNTTVLKLKEDLSDAKSLQSDKVVLKEALEKLEDVRILTDEDWMSFQKKFKKIHPEFRSTIKKIAPTITTSEMRYLMLTQLKFSHKEMALALGISSSSMRVTWNRVRKRLNATTDDTPTSLLERILNEEAPFKVSH